MRYGVMGASEIIIYYGSPGAGERQFLMAWEEFDSSYWTREPLQSLTISQGMSSPVFK